MSQHELSSDALDERIAFLGTAGSGKTYGAGTLIERLLATGRRTIIFDPLGVWWGLRVKANGLAPSDFHPVIIGGDHADLPLTPSSGAIVGEAIGDTADSVIVDLSALGTKAAERRWMLACLTALYRRKSREPVHLIYDEADMWAPQRLLDKDGEAAKLLGMMETIVRRGRVRGFVPWLITQRPAVLSKDVLSQMLGLAILRLTAPQDIGAIRAWVEGQADAGVWARIAKALPGMARGHAVFWLPARDIFEEDYAFDRKVTFDSSAAPTRGASKDDAHRPTGPLDTGELAKKLAGIEAEVKARDPAALKKRIAELEALVVKGVDSAIDTGKIKAEGYREGQAAERKAWQSTVDDISARLDTISAAIAASAATTVRDLEQAKRNVEATEREATEAVVTLRKLLRALDPTQRPAAPSVTRRPASSDIETWPGTAAAGNAMLKRDGAPVDPGLPPAKVKILVALRQLEAIGHMPADRLNVAIFAGVSANSSGFANNLGSLRTLGYIDYPQPGMIALTEAGQREVGRQRAPTHADLMALLATLIPPAQMKLLDLLSDDYPQPMDREKLASLACVSAASSGYANNLGRLRSLGLIDYPQSGFVKATAILFP